MKCCGAQPTPLLKRCHCCRFNSPLAHSPHLAPSKKLLANGLSALASRRVTNLPSLNPPPCLDSCLCGLHASQAAEDAILACIERGASAESEAVQLALAVLPPQLREALPGGSAASHPSGGASSNGAWRPQPSPQQSPAAAAEGKAAGEVASHENGNAAATPSFPNKRHDGVGFYPGVCCEVTCSRRECASRVPQ